MAHCGEKGEHAVCKVADRMRHYALRYFINKKEEKMGQKYETILYEKDEHILKITLNRPERHNAINKQLSTELNSALLEAKSDDEVRAIIITGAGKSFCSGVDLKEFYGRGVTALETRDFHQVFYREMTDIQNNLGKPTIAALNGATIAAGCSVAFSCDVLIASEKCFIGYAEINVGVMAALHLVLVPRLIGRHKAFELLVSGDNITAKQAAKMGLINRVVPPDSLEKEAYDLARKFASKSPLLLKFYKDCFYTVADMEYRKGLAYVIEALGVLVTSEDHKEGVRAFMEKRAPVWTGR
ncbi:enoyl-CoA hydratase/isomerase family protein [Chloroflexota bacterium]